MKIPWLKFEPKYAWGAWAVLVIILLISVLLDFPVFAYFIVLCIVGPFLLLGYYVLIQPRIDEKNESKNKKERLSKISEEIYPILNNRLKKVEKTLPDKNIKIKLTFIKNGFKKFKYKWIELENETENLLVGFTTIAGFLHISINEFIVDQQDKSLNEKALSIKSDLLKNGYRNKTFFIAINDVITNDLGKFSIVKRKEYQNNPSKQDISYVYDALNEVIDKINSK